MFENGMYFIAFLNAVNIDCPVRTRTNIKKVIFSNSCTDFTKLHKTREVLCDSLECFLFSKLGSAPEYAVTNSNTAIKDHLLPVGSLKISPQSFFSPPLGAARHSITSSVTLDYGTSSKPCTASASPRRICPIASVSHCLRRWHLSSFHISQVSAGHKVDYSAGRLCIHFQH